MWKERTVQVQHRTVHEDVYRVLREAILNGEFRPGERLLQEELAGHLGVSRMPVREALHRLGAEGLVTVTPHKGVTVASFDPGNIKDVYEVRSEVEGLAARRAARNASTDDLAALGEILHKLETAQIRRDQAELTHLNRAFHLLLTRSSHSKLIADMVEQLWYRFPRYIFTMVPAEVERANREHRAIYEAVCRGDGAHAERLVTAHIVVGCEALMKYVTDSDRFDMVP